ncbi:MAG: class I SAM-dependent methyltransferase family protein [Candidatus Parvarchaeota archaeon]|nr:class I SAM-dependent methyltransferase family protein [Candidatus Jingweiarchaeum tengchongense]MCW1298351.1 class I SAM-dependent methyltransferase family protein [Candidatus Jingweiarchaeum tengchongense]MCW1300347.1 class I SAM-dependent methyltransferase family protein [Candidatus Jingweiarchaeum tengchongense]MCW1304856.1 class I SAM-dependent methyltransferase family protein [Candidatus Jingweiarchaeum tengchongense]MCW1305843.1 class I SAM-dependent methyltransferase family protein [
MASVIDLLKNKLSDEELELVPRAYDMVGDIIVLELDEKLRHKEKEIASAFLKFHKNARVICKKIGFTSGEERVRPIKIIAGEKRTETIHKENNCRYKVDLSKVFFTPRLANERLRIANQVKDGEVIVDLFAGVGPFSILIAKRKNVKIFAIDKNKYAYKFLIENIKLNKVEDKITAFWGDCRDVVKKENLVNVADRVIMNLPKQACDFLDIAFLCAKKNATIHFYYFLPEEEIFDGAIKIIKERAKEFGKKIKILNSLKCGDLAPRVYRVVIDFSVNY